MVEREPVETNTDSVIPVPSETAACVQPDFAAPDPMRDHVALLEAEYTRLRDDLRYQATVQVAYLAAIVALTGALVAAFSTSSLAKVPPILRAASPLLLFALAGIFAFSSMGTLLTNKHARLLEGELDAYYARREPYSSGVAPFPSRLLEIQHQVLGPNTTSAAFLFLNPAGYAVFLGTVLGSTVIALWGLHSKLIIGGALVIYGLLSIPLLGGYVAFARNLGRNYDAAVKTIRTGNATRTNFPLSGRTIRYLTLPRTKEALAKSLLFGVIPVLVMSALGYRTPGFGSVLGLALLYNLGLYPARYLLNDIIDDVRDAQSGRVDRLGSIAERLTKRDRAVLLGSVVGRTWVASVILVLLSNERVFVALAAFLIVTVAYEVVKLHLRTGQIDTANPLGIGRIIWFVVLLAILWLGYIVRIMSPFIFASTSVDWMHVTGLSLAGGSIGVFATLGSWSSRPITIDHASEHPHRYLARSIAPWRDGNPHGCRRLPAIIVIVLVAVGTTGIVLLFLD